MRSVLFVRYKKRLYFYSVFEVLSYPECFLTQDSDMKVKNVVFIPLCTFIYYKSRFLVIHSINRIF